jgi:hypothetical protein
MRRLLLTVLLLYGFAGAVSAQGGLPGTNVRATPRVRSVSTEGDTTSIVLSVSVDSASLEHLFGITVRVTAPGRRVVSPGADSDWAVATQFAGKTSAGWWSMGTISPGDSTPTLTFSAVGVPGIDTVWFTGDSVLKPVPDTGYYPAYETLRDQSAKSMTIGVDSPPPTFDSLLGRLHGLTDSSCALGWITDSGLCSALDAHLTASPSEYLAFSDELDSARTHGSAVSDAAYFLLHGNLTYINTVVDTSKLTLPDYCDAHNGNATAVTVQLTFIGYGSSGDTTFYATLPGNTTAALDSHGLQVTGTYMHYAGVRRTQISMYPPVPHYYCTP